MVLSRTMQRSNNPRKGCLQSASRIVWTNRCGGWECPVLLVCRGTRTCVWQNESRLIGGRAVRAPTLERATFKSIASQWRSRHKGITSRQAICEKQANCGHGQRGRRHRGRANNYYCKSKPNGGRGQQGRRHRGRAK
jgi:hypothetical protein